MWHNYNHTIGFRPILESRKLEVAQLQSDYRGQPYMRIKKAVMWHNLSHKRGEAIIQL